MTKTIYIAHAEVAKFSPIVSDDVHECIEEAAEYYNLEYDATNLEKWEDTDQSSRAFTPILKVYKTHQWFDRVGLYEVEV